MNRPTTAQHPRPLRGFTLIELLVVISIIGIIAGLGLPFLSRILDGNKVSAGVNAVTVAVQSTRLLSTSRETAIGTAVGSRFSGTALIVTPPLVGEMRLTENDQLATTGLGSAGTALEGLVNRDGFRDIPGIDVVTIPAGVRIVGLSREAGSANLQILQPPFAIRFNENGNLVVGSDRPSGGLPNPPNLVDYDGDVDTRFEGTVRPSGYNVDAFNPTFVAAEEKLTLPFERFETVPAIRVIRIDDDPANPADDFADVFFSRSTGTPTVIRNAGIQGN